MAAFVTRQVIHLGERSREIPILGVLRLVESPPSRMKLAEYVGLQITQSETFEM